MYCLDAPIAENDRTSGDHRASIVDVGGDKVQRFVDSIAKDESLRRILQIPVHVISNDYSVVIDRTRRRRESSGELDARELTTAVFKALIHSAGVCC